MNRYTVILKNGMVFEAENRWLDTSSVHHELCDREPFIQIGDTVFAKGTIAVIQKIEEEKPEEKEEEVF
jgi:hypothetical protein